MGTEYPFMDRQILGVSVQQDERRVWRMVVHYADSTSVLRTSYFTRWGARRRGKRLAEYLQVPFWGG